MLVKASKQAFFIYNSNTIYILFTNRCGTETELNETVSQLLCALLQRLTDLERHEQYLRACQANNNTSADEKVCTIFFCSITDDVLINSCHF